MPKKMKTWLGAGTGLLLAAAVGFILPGLLLSWQDERLLGRVEQEETGRMVITEQPELTVVEKVRLIQSDSVNYMPLTKGKNYSQSTIGEQIGKELSALSGLGLLKDTPGAPKDIFMEAYFVMDMDGEKSMIVWSGQLYLDSGLAALLLLDDETGRILGMVCGQEAESVYGGSLFDWLNEPDGWYDTSYKGEVPSNAAETGAEQQEYGYGGGALVDETEERGQEEDSPADPGESLMNTLLQGWGEYLDCETGEVSVGYSDDIYRSVVEDPAFQAEVQSFLDAGYTEEEAWRYVGESWGFAGIEIYGEASYLDESGQEMRYQLRCPLYGEDLSIRMIHF